VVLHVVRAYGDVPPTYKERSSRWAKAVPWRREGRLPAPPAQSSQHCWGHPPAQQFLTRYLLWWATDTDWRWCSLCWTTAISG